MKLVSKILKRTDWYVTCNFGYYRNRGVLEYHCGTDYGTNNQKWNIHAIEQGVVLSCGTEGGAKYIWVHYPRINKRIVHCHLDRIDVRAGQQLQEGTLLGCVGNTGSTTGIHLHLGMMPCEADCYEDPHAYEYSSPADMMNSDATVYGGPGTAIYAPVGTPKTYFTDGELDAIAGRWSGSPGRSNFCNEIEAHADLLLNNDIRAQACHFAMTVFPGGRTEEEYFNSVGCADLAFGDSGTDKQIMDVFWSL